MSSDAMTNLLVVDVRQITCEIVIRPILIICLHERINKMHNHISPLTVVLKLRYPSQGIIDRTNGMVILRIQQILCGFVCFLLICDRRQAISLLRLRVSQQI
jgi:hypothetical protein